MERPEKENQTSHNSYADFHSYGRKRTHRIASKLSVIDGMPDRPCYQTAGIIRNEEMEQFKFMLDYSEETVRFQNEPLAPGEKVEVIKGPLKGLQGELVELAGHSEVMIRIDHLGYATVEIPVGYVKKL